MDVLWSLLQDEGLPELLGSMLNPAGLLPDWNCLLLAADPPERSDLTLADLVEPTNGGYSRKIVHRPDWTVAIPSTGCAHATLGGNPLTWFAESGSTPIYGAAFIRPADGKLIVVFRFTDAARPTWASGSTLTLSPVFPLTSATC